ncbi:MAG: demethylmenaquinone methyltransferase [Veillonellaceae bacterium]|jgi:demethylmenaquinone methyltransferase/2-methoxy-6-polyprenyl-1,4-benzoquinol methylase|nr:demethylmenaquinone methyltransferase [Veillonellaceae bacterium]
MKHLTTNKEQFVHKLFTAICSHYDFMNSMLSCNQDRYWRRFALQKAELQPGNKVLDVCCGTGKLTLGLAAQVSPAGQVIGLDFCKAMLDIAEKNISKSPVKEVITLVQGNALALPFPDNEFNCAITGFGLRNLPDINKALAEMCRVTRPGGTVISLELAKPTAPVLKQLYYFYFEQILPLLGKLKVGADGFYSWLPQSLKDYPHQKDIAVIFENHGLSNVQYFELTGGIAAVHVGIK